MVLVWQYRSEDQDSVHSVLDGSDFAWWGPEHRLLWAVLERAVKDASLINGLMQTVPRKTYQIRPMDHIEAVKWLRSDSVKPFSFLWSVEVLGLLPGHTSEILSRVPKQPYGVEENLTDREWRRRLRYRATKKRRIGG